MSYLVSHHHYLTQTQSWLLSLSHQSLTHQSLTQLSVRLHPMQHDALKLSVNQSLMLRGGEGRL